MSKPTDLGKPTGWNKSAGRTKPTATRARGLAPNRRAPNRLGRGNGLPLVVLVGPGQGNDCPMFPHLLDHLKVARIGPGRPRTRPDRLRADKVYSSRGNRALLRARGIVAVIPEPSDQGAAGIGGAAGVGPGGMPLAPCRMAFLRAALDDPELADDPTWRCGRCDSCGAAFPDVVPDADAVAAARAATRVPGVELGVRRAWPTGMATLGVPVSGKVAEGDRAEVGRAVARLQGIGWGQVLRELFAPGPDGAAALLLRRAGADAVHPFALGVG